MSNQATSTQNFRQAKLTPLYKATPDWRGFLESVLGFSNLANHWIRVSHADQRRYFGRIPFGNSAIKVSDTGTIRLTKTKAFGRDFDSIEFIINPGDKQFLSVFDGRPIATPSNI